MEKNVFKRNINKKFFLLVLIICCPFFSFAQADISLKKLKKHISYLASDKLQGRGTGSKGEQKAGSHELVFSAKKAGYSAGVYTLRMVIGEGIYTTKLIETE